MENSPEKSLPNDWLDLLGKLGQGSIQGGSILLNGIFNLIGKWIDAWGMAMQAAGETNPAGLAAFVGWTALNVTAIVYFLTTEPYKSILKGLKVYDLLNGIANQIGNVGNDINNFLNTPSGSTPLGSQLFGKPIPIGTFGSGDFCMTVSPKEWGQIVSIFTSVPATASGRQCFQTAAERDAAIAALNNNSALNWYWVASPS